MASNTRCVAPLPIAFGSGACTRMPSWMALRFSRSTAASTSSRVAVAGMRVQSAWKPHSSAALSLCFT